MTSSITDWSSPTTPTTLVFTVAPPFDSNIATLTCTWVVASSYTA